MAIEPLCKRVAITLSDYSGTGVVEMIGIGGLQWDECDVCCDEPAVTGVVTEATWKELVLESPVPVLVDFWAPWCGPCRMIAPLIDEIAKQYAGKVRCLKLNTDESPGIATEYGIRSIPTVMVFTKGDKRDTVIGAVPKSTLTTTLEKFIDQW